MPNDIPGDAATGSSPFAQQICQLESPRDLHDVRAGRYSPGQKAQRAQRAGWERRAIAPPYMRSPSIPELSLLTVLQHSDTPLAFSVHPSREQHSSTRPGNEPNSLLETGWTLLLPLRCCSINPLVDSISSSSCTMAEMDGGFAD